MKHHKYFQIGVTVFLTVCAILLVYDTLFGSRSAVVFWRKISSTLAPIFYGALIAYLLAPVVDFFEGILFPARVARARASGILRAPGPRAVSLMIVWALICVLLYVLLSFLLPELYRSIVLLWSNLELYYNTINRWLTGLLESNPGAERLAASLVEGYYQDLLSIFTDKVLPQTQQLMTAVSGGVVSALVFLKNLVVGVIVSVYLLATKERCAAHGRKLVYGFTSEKTAPWIFRGIGRMDFICSGFVRGKLLDSLIIGLICFICTQLLSIPYAPLVSVIVGVTNVIPFFGPFLGAIPSLFLILLVDPLKALYFLIFIIALQQVDGNIIGPKILGGTTGLSSLWVIIAILVGGSFFGVPGMFFGVPVCACLFSLVDFLLGRSLREKHLPQETDAYRSNPPVEPGGGAAAKPKSES